MKFRQIDDSPKTFVLVFATGDELAEGLLRFAQEQQLSAASFKAIGALASVRLGWFSWESKRRFVAGALGRHDPQRARAFNRAMRSYSTARTARARG
jgi:predicted DNA-binding protein with PD1-like motif